MAQALGPKAAEYMIIYLDDILITSKTLEEHLIHLKYVIEKLNEVGFKVNRDKCEFIKREIKFLGHTFSEITAEINQDTRNAIKNIARPRNKRDMQSFLGLVNWDRRFIRNLSRLTQPLEELLRKNKKFEWTAVQQKAFKNIKNSLRRGSSVILDSKKL